MHSLSKQPHKLNTSSISPKNPVTKEAAQWLHQSLIWLIIACILGLAQSIPTIGVLLGENWINASTGRLMLARQGALIYGWGLSNIIGIIAYVLVLGDGRTGAWLRCLRWLWHASVAIGLCTVLWSSGSGLWTMPFASWTLPSLLLILGGITYIIASSYSKQVNYWTWLPISSAFGMLWVALTGGYWVGGDGILGTLAMSCVQSSISICLTVICFTAFAQTISWTQNKSWRTISILLILLSLVAPPLLGACSLETFPVPWKIVELSQQVGIATMSVLLFAALASLLALVRASKAKVISSSTTHWYEAGLIAMILWMICSLLSPWGVDWHQFSIALWHENNLWLYGSIGMLGLAIWLANGGLQKGKTERLWAFGGLFLVITWSIAVYANINVQNLPADKQSAFLSSWGSFISIFESITWILLGLSAICWWRISHKSLGTAYNNEKVQRTFRPIQGMIALIIISSIGAGTWYYIGILPQEISSFEVKRPGTNTTGARVFASEGCAVCHTQMIRALPSGKDLQHSLDTGGNGKGIARISIPEDYEPEANEGAAHIGYARLGPDLFQLQARVENYVQYLDPNGRIRATATPQEWLYLHLYNPRDPMFGKPWTLCPPMPQLFEIRPMLASTPSPEALPLKAPDNYEIIPTPAAVQLVAYLSTLKRGELSPKIGQENATRKVSFLNPKYIATPPTLDQSKFKAKHAAIAHEEGRQIYSARCAICHGNEGKGNTSNYPPVLKSEWISGDTKTLALIIRYGLTGPISVQGKAWDSTMLPTGISQATEIAALINYLRWQYAELESPPVTAEQVNEWISLPATPEKPLRVEDLPKAPVPQNK